MRSNVFSILEILAWSYVILLSILGFVVEPMGFFQTTADISFGSQPPSWSHLLGTDMLGRDLLSLLIQGIKNSLLIAFLSSSLLVFIGSCYGAISGYYGGLMDYVMMRILEILDSIPVLIFLILCASWIKQSFLVLPFIAASIAWTKIARLVRIQTKSIKEKDFVLAAICMGVKPFQIFYRHILPHLWPTILIYGSSSVPRMILAESFLSFLGMGIPLPSVTLGVLIMESLENMESSPWLILSSCLTFGLFSLAFQIISFFIKERFLGR